MTVVFEGKRSIWLGSQAVILGDNDHDVAWAEKLIKFNPAYKWILGKYAEADRANSNQQFWSLKDLRFGQPTIQHAPMNFVHQPRRIVGTFVGTEMMYPTEAAAADGSQQNPYIEALGVFYRYYFPEEFEIIERAHREGTLWLSMECQSRSLTCVGPNSCGKEFDYKGPQDESYCNHINHRETARQFNDPVFLAGALIVPPVKPGWKNASVQDISGLMSENALECEMAYEQVKSEMPDQSPQVWEALMGQIVGLANADTAAVLNAKKRNDLPTSAFAIPGKRAYPIHDLNHAKNALARSAGKPEEGQVKAAVYKKYPALKGSKK